MPGLTDWKLAQPANIAIEVRTNAKRPARRERFERRLLELAEEVIVNLVIKKLFLGLL